MGSGDSSGGSWAVPWPALAAAFIALSSALLYFSPLRSSRPAAPPGSPVDAIGYQDAPARLWQDPFKATVDGRRTMGSAAQAWRAEVDARGATSRPSVLVSPEPRRFEGPRHDLAEIRAQIAEARGSTLVLCVMIPAAGHAELAEQRLRARVAVLEALGVAGFEPVDGEHIGFFRMPWLWKSLEQPGTTAAAALQAATEQYRDAGSLLVPYEWATPTAVRMGGSRPLRTNTEFYEQAVVLWLAEEAVADQPLTRIAHMLKTLDLVPEKEEETEAKKQFHVRVIGPRVSSTLRRMVTELQHAGADDLTALRAVPFYSPTATADDALLLGGAAGTVADLFRLNRLTFERTTVTDRTLCDDLVTELERRGLRNLRADPVLAKGKMIEKRFRDTDVDHIALVAEWDTVYGRALPATFAAAVMGPNVNAAEMQRNGYFPDWVHPFVYLRGIDGHGLEGGAERERSNLTRDGPGNPRDEATKLNAPGEKPEGTNQSDYLRRLADQLVHVDEELRARRRGGLRAIGVLGTDLYDKLLVMRALRDRLPGPIYFTTTLDARYALPSEWKAAHNLVIASPYGLRLHAHFQDNVPPFRDSYQTATFATALYILEQVPQRLAVPATATLQVTNGPTPGPPPTTRPSPPRLFEIARGGPIDLTVVDRSDYRQLDPTRSGSPELWTGEVPHMPASIHPPRYDLRPWAWNPIFKWGALLALALLLCTAIALGVRPDKFSWLKAISSSGTFWVVTIPTIILVICLGISYERVEGEPFRLAEGVSIWPTVAVRLLAAMLCIYFMIRAYVRTRENDGDIQRDFRLKGLPGQAKWHEAEPDPPADVASEAQPDEFRAPPKTFAPSLGLGHWDVMYPGTPQKPEQVAAQNLWWEYQRRSVWSYRLVRVGLMSALFIVLALCLMWWLGRPQSPARGEWAQGFELASLLLAIPLSVALTFVVLDITYVNKRFIDYLLKTNTVWPRGAFEQIDWGLNAEDLTEYLDVRLIARRTTVVGEVIYFPFVIFVLMIVSRNPLFDNWDWPAGLLLIMTGSLILAILGALMLRGSAEEARLNALNKLRDRFMRYKVLKDSGKADAIEQVIKLVRDEREGAFSILSQYPWLAAVILPSSGLGLWALLDYAARAAW